MSKESFEGGEIDPQEIERYRDIVEQLKSDIDRYIQVSERARDFLDTKSGDVRNYHLWHDLVGSTVPDGVGIPFDSSDRLVRDFIDDLAKEFLND